MNYKIISIALCLALTACSGDSDDTGDEPPPPVVKTVVLTAHSVPYKIKMPGRVEPRRTADVRARATGIVEDVLYTEGADVKKGQLLFRIDPRQREAAFGKAKATLQRAEATAANRSQVAKRYSGLVKEKAISQQEYDSAVADARGAEADVALAKAAVDAAQLDLDYTNVTSPIAGRTSRAQVRAGSLVSETEATLLTVVRQIDKVYVNLSQSTSNVLEVRREITEGVIKVPDAKNVEVTLSLENGAAYGIRGHLDFLDLTVAEKTGSVLVRAEFDNPDSALLPGQFVRATIHAGVRPDGIEVPQRAVQISNDKATVMLVGDDNTVTSKEVILGMLDGKQWLVKSGLKGGDRVIVDGVQKVRDGGKVQLQCDSDDSCDKSDGKDSGTSSDSGTASDSTTTAQRANSEPAAE